jgi:hypothetical protein
MNPVMERRASRRHRVNTSIVCSFLSAGRCAKTFDGRMMNCCISGLGIELKTQLKAGTVLVVRATGGSCGYSGDEGFRSVALAEVKWSKQKPMEGQSCYTTGLKYVFI